MSEDSRVRARRESQEHLDALRGVVDERTWELFELVLARLTRLETGDFPTNEAPTKPEHRFTSTEKGPGGPKPSLTPEKLPAVLDPKLLPAGRPKRFDSTEKWTADKVKDMLTGARVESGLEPEPDPFPLEPKGPEKK